MKLMTILTASMLFISGCGAVALQSKPQEVSTLPQGQGVIVGSIVLKTQKTSAAFPIKLSGKTWHVLVRPVDDGLVSKMLPKGKELDVVADGTEVPFVSMLPRGTYKIEELYTTSAIDPNYELTLRLNFAVEENKKTYLGRLIITIPSEVNMFKTMLFADNNTSIVIEDAQADTVALLSGAYGAGLAEGLQKQLMAVQSTNQRLDTAMPPGGEPTAR